MKLEYARSFLKDIKRVKDRNIRSRLEVVLLDLESAAGIESVIGIVAMSGATAYYRMRIGGYRLGLKQEDEGTIRVVRFLSRGEIYRYFP